MNAQGSIGGSVVVVFLATVFLVGCNHRGIEHHTLEGAAARLGVSEQEVEIAARRAEMSVSFYYVPDGPNCLRACELLNDRDIEQIRKYLSDPKVLDQRIRCVNEDLGYRLHKLELRVESLQAEAEAKDRKNEARVLSPE